MIAWWKRLKKSTPEQEDRFQEMLKEEKVSWKDRFAMLLAAYVSILLPCAIILVALALLAMWMFGAL